MVTLLTNNARLCSASLALSLGAGSEASLSNQLSVALRRVNHGDDALTPINLRE